MKKLAYIALTLLFCFVSSTMTFAPEIVEPPQEELEAAVELTPELTPELPPTPSPTPKPTPVPTPEPTPEFFDISFIGDCTLASDHYSKGVSSSYNNVVGDNYAYPFEKTVQFFNDDDFTLANLECVLSDYKVPAIKSFVFGAVPEYANILIEGSVEFVSLGNNHVEDYGEQGYLDTKAVLDEYNIAYAGRDEWTLYDANGLTIGVYAVSFGTTAQIEAGIAALKEAGAEFIIAAMHWGDEGSYKVNGTQRTQGYAAIDAGADVVYGSHPHTLQPMEEYNGKYIFYSMGNWSFGGNTNPRDKDTAIVKLEVIRDVDGSVSVCGYELIPCALSGVANGNNYQPVPYEVDSEEYLRAISKLDGSFAGPNLSVNYQYNFSEF